MKKLKIILLVLIFSLSLMACSSSKVTEVKVRPDTWAQAIEKSGLPNFYKVSEELYRGARPEVEGFKELEKMGIKTVINLEAYHSDEDEMEEAEVDINYYQIPMYAWYPEDKELIEFLDIISNKENAPFFVHCKHGADRTGITVATYRIIVEGWSKEEAIDEMKNGGYGFHKIWVNLIKYMEDLDVNKISSAYSNQGTY